MQYQILALGGDGIGPEVLDSGIQIIKYISKIKEINIKIEHDLIGGICWDKHKSFCLDTTVIKAKKSDAVLVGSVGGPKWDKIRIEGPPEKQDGLMRLRKELNAFLGLRPVIYYNELYLQSPIKKNLIKNSDILVLREMTGGAMFGQPRGLKTRDKIRYAYDTAIYNEEEIKRFAIAGFELAKTRKGKLCSIDKANVMESYKLWRDVVEEVSKDYKEIELTHYYADNCAFQLIMNPKKFDVILGCNLFGDIFSDLAAVVSGGLGLLPSACLCGSPNGFVKGIYEPVHGSAPDIAGTGKANPLGMILSVALMFKYSLDRSDICLIIESAVKNVIKKGFLTPDLGGDTSTKDITKKILCEIHP